MLAKIAIDFWLDTKGIVTKDNGRTSKVDIETVRGCFKRSSVLLQACSLGEGILLDSGGWDVCSNPNGCPARLRKSTLLQGSLWPLGQYQADNIQWLTSVDWGCPYDSSPNTVGKPRQSQQTKKAVSFHEKPLVRDLEEVTRKRETGLVL